MLMDGRADLLYPTTYVVIEVGEEAEPDMPAASTLLVGDGSPEGPPRGSPLLSVAASRRASPLLSAACTRLPIPPSISLEPPRSAVDVIGDLVILHAQRAPFVAAHPRSYLPATIIRSLSVDRRARSISDARGETRMASSLFRCWLGSDSHRTSIPVGRCRARTAESVTSRCWPPAPDPRIVSTSTSSGRMVSATSRCSASTAIVIVLVCTRPRFSVGGTRCQRCPPGSPANSAAAPRPVITSDAKPGRSSTSWRQRDLRPQSRRSIFTCSSTRSLASVPPSAARISTMTESDGIWIPPWKAGDSNPTAFAARRLANGSLHLRELTFRVWRDRNRTRPLSRHAVSRRLSAPAWTSPSRSRYERLLLDE